MICGPSHQSWRLCGPAHPIHLPLPYGVSFARAVDLTGKLQPYELIPKEGGQLFLEERLDRALIHAAFDSGVLWKKQLKHEDPLDALILDFLDAKKGDGK